MAPTAPPRLHAREAAAAGVTGEFRRAWVRRVGWYPGDWAVTSLLTLLIAIAGAAVAIVLADRGASGGTTYVAAPPARAPASTTAPTVTFTRSTTTTVATTTTTPTKKPVAKKSAPKRAAPPAAAPGHYAWPGGTSGWTDVLASYPVVGGHLAAAAAAGEAARAGLPKVGVLESSGFSSLHSGFYVVFSGVYASQTAAEAGLARARSGGFGSAYVRQISR